VASNTAAACRVRVTVILRDPVTGTRIMQSRGSVVGETTLARASSAPTAAWPGRKGLMVTSIVRRTRALTPAVMRRAQLLLVRRIATNPLQPAGAANPAVAQRDAFSSRPGWPTGQ
jgi:hypothetical protein